MMLLNAPSGASARSRHHTDAPQIVVIDPGHGGSEPGAADASGQLLEKDLTLRVAKAAQARLARMGYAVYLTRTRDRGANYPPRDLNQDGKINRVDDFDARSLFANRHHADVFVSIHFDGSTDPTIRGTHGYYCPARPFWRQSQTLATMLTAAIASALQKSGYRDVNGGVETDVADIVPQTRQDYPWFLVLGPSRHHFITGTAMPGALIETLYLSSPDDAAALRHRATIDTLAKGYATGIAAYLKSTSH